MNEDTLRKELAATAHQLWLAGVLPGTAGCVTLEITRRRHLTTPSGRRRSQLKPDELVVLDMEGRDLSGEAHLPSDLWWPHREAYRWSMSVLPEDIRKGDGRHLGATLLAVPPKLTALMQLEPESRSLHLPGHPPLPVVWNLDVAAFNKWLPRHPVIALQGLGVFSSGGTLGEAAARLEEAEHAAGIELLVRQSR